MASLSKTPSSPSPLPLSDFVLPTPNPNLPFSVCVAALRARAPALQLRPYLPMSAAFQCDPEPDKHRALWWNQPTDDAAAGAKAKFRKHLGRDVHQPQIHQHILFVPLAIWALLL